jgi:ABC-type antimicrobial peptide transport system ATPase subunit
VCRYLKGTWKILIDRMRKGRYSLFQSSARLARKLVGDPIREPDLFLIKKGFPARTQ